MAGENKITFVLTKDVRAPLVLDIGGGVTFKPHVPKELTEQEARHPAVLRAISKGQIRRVK
ncbi:hypothetical protein KKA53_04865 [Candidatus Dependentiae bacterium]|nr:hypothetical protein [Candidatus Dependentiae bacterium]